MRPIDADRLKETIKELDAESPDIKTARIVNRVIQEIFPQIIDDEPTLDYAPVEHGRWMYPFYCSACGFEPYYSSDLTYNYCPNCGARMDGDSE